MGLLLTGMTLLVSALCYGQLISTYKKGVIKLEADPQFGRNENWDLHIRDERQDLLVLPDGTIYIASALDHCVRMFDPTGKFIKKFGQKGQGPGDLSNPGSLSVLDKNILVVGEYATLLRISLFELDGTFMDIIKTKNSCFRPVALSKGKIAYLALHYGPETNSSQDIRKEITILDIHTGEEFVVDRFDHVFKYRTNSRGAMTSDDAFPEEVFFAQTQSGNLVTGSTDRSFLNVFSPSGKKLRTITLNMDLPKVTRDYIERLREHKIRSYDDRKDKSFYEGLINAIQKSDFFIKPGQNFPSMKEIIVDSQGHVLVFKFTDCVGKCQEVFQVYSEEGEYLCETVVDSGIYDLDIDYRFKNMVFTSDGIIGLFMRKDSEDMTLRLVKIPILQ
jgi:hypothetical protein